MKKTGVTKRIDDILAKLNAAERRGGDLASGLAARELSAQQLERVVGGLIIRDPGPLPSKTTFCGGVADDCGMESSIILT
jgi:hypothetical protein